MVPVGDPDPPPLAVTVAVNITNCPKFDGLTLLIKEVVVESLFTTCVTFPELV
jgi:hypothetical protein